MSTTLHDRAVAVHPEPVHWWSEASGFAHAALHRGRPAPGADSQPPQQEFHKCYDFLEDSCMAREMERL